jgi:hypothetical protein
VLRALVCRSILADLSTLPVFRNLEMKLGMSLYDSLRNGDNWLVMDVARLVLVVVTGDRRSVLAFFILQTDLPVGK